MKVNKFFTGLVLCLSMFQMSVPAFADEAQLVNAINQMQKEMSEMRRTIELQNQKITRLESKAPEVNFAPQPGSAASQNLQMSSYDFNQMLDESTGGAQKWLKGMKQGGDLRLRYEAFKNNAGNTARDADRNRFRFRLRYGIDKTFNDQMKAGFSVASGERVTNNGHNSDPTSTNQTLGNLYDFKNIWIEKAYATYTPNWAKVGPVSYAEVTAGKFNNPFEKGSTDLIWDRDVKPEGIYESANFKLLDSGDLKLNAYATAGQFVLQENSALGRDAQMFGYQMGLNPVFYTPWAERPVDILSAVSYYDYANYQYNNAYRIDQNTTGQSLANGNSVCSSGGNNNLCTSFRIVDFYNEINLAPYGLPVRPFGEYAHNLASGLSSFDQNAWSYGFKLGKQVKKGDWELTYAYKYIGADSVVGAFADSDFGYRGYAGNKGHVLKAGYKLTDDLTLNLSGYFVRNLNIGEVLDASAGSIKSETQNRFQADLTWKF